MAVGCRPNLRCDSSIPKQWPTNRPTLEVAAAADLIYEFEASSQLLLRGEVDLPPVEMLLLRLGRVTPSRSNPVKSLLLW